MRNTSCPNTIAICEFFIIWQTVEKMKRMIRIFNDSKMLSASRTLWETVSMPLTQRTAQIIHNTLSDLQQIKWTDGEANTDSGFSRLACVKCQEAWEEIKESFPEHKDLSVVCKSPDINVIFSRESTIVASGKIELKSGKGKGLIPGSTIGGLDINEPVIFCLRNESESTFAIRYSQYHNCIGESNTDMFQDRTPRPHVNFSKMAEVSTAVEYIHKEKSDWVEHYAKCALFRTKAKKPYKSWQDNMTEKLLELFIKETSVEEFARRKAELV